MEINKNSTKTYFLGALIITISLIIMGVSLSYAYFVNSVEEVEEHKANKRAVITSGALTMNFATSRTLTATGAGLVTEEQALGSNNYTAFSVTLPADGKVDSAKYDLYLTDTKMTTNFKSADLKWALYSGSTKINSGDFSGVTLSSPSSNIYSATDISLLDTSAPISKGDTVSYKLYVWLNYDPNNQQNGLLQGSLSTKVAFRAVSQ